MIKPLVLIILLFVLLSVSVSAASFVVGTIYKDGMIAGNELGGANVNATCEGYVEKTTSSNETDFEGDYVIMFVGNNCPDGSNVLIEASYGDMADSSNKVMHGSLVGSIDMAVGSVSIPEFGTIAAGIALLGSLLGVFVIRKNHL